MFRFTRFLGHFNFAPSVILIKVLHAVVDVDGFLHVDARREANGAKTLAHTRRVVIIADRHLSDLHSEGNMLVSISFMQLARKIEKVKTLKPRKRTCWEV